MFGNIFKEQLRQTVKYECNYLKQYRTATALAARLGDYFQLYNFDRPHQSFGYRTPVDVHFKVEAPIMRLADLPDFCRFVVLTLGVTLINNLTL